MIPTLPIRVFSDKSTLICSLASGDNHIAMMQIMAPTVSYYASIHGMDCLLLPLPFSRLDPTRPAAWDKIILIRHMLEIYETVIWIDSDAIIRNPWCDIRQELQLDYPISLTAHHHIQGAVVANTGVMVIKSNTETINFLEAIWEYTELIKSSFWEQDALMDLIGFNPRICPGFPYRGETQYSHLIWFLGNEWNSICNDVADDPIIMHYAGIFPYELRIKDMYADSEKFFSRLSNPI